MENEVEKTISLNDIFSLILFHMKSIIIVAVLVALATFGITYTMEKPTYTYRGSMMIYTSLASDDSGNMTITQSGQAYLVANYYVGTYIGLLQSNSFCALVSDDVVEQLSKGASDAEKQKIAADLSAGSIRGMISIQKEEDLLVFDISVSSKNQKYAQAVAESVMKNAPDFSKLYGESCQLQQVDSPIGSVSMKSPVSMAVVAFAAAALAMTLLFLIIHAFDRKVRDEIGLADQIGVPVLGVIPDFGTAIKNK